MRLSWGNNAATKIVTVNRLRDSLQTSDRHLGRHFWIVDLAGYIADQEDGENNQLQLVYEGVDMWWLTATAKLWMLVTNHGDRTADSQLLIDMIDAIPVGIESERLYYYWMSKFINCTNQFAKDEAIAALGATYHAHYESGETLKAVEVSNFYYPMWRSMLVAYSMNILQLDNAIYTGVNVLASSLPGVPIHECKTQAVLMLVSNWIETMKNVGV